MAKTVCKAKKTGQVKSRGKFSIEWRDKDGTPHGYCHGYLDSRTEELLPVCKECRDNVNFAQEDLEKSRGYNKGNDCDCCENQYRCGEWGESLGCRCIDECRECEFIEVTV